MEIKLFKHSNADFVVQANLDFEFADSEFGDPYKRQKSETTAKANWLVLGKK